MDEGSKSPQPVARRRRDPAVGGASPPGPGHAGVAAYWPLDNAIKGFGGTSNQSGAFVDDAERGRVLEVTGRSRESVTLSPSVVDGSGSFTVAVRVKLGDLDKPTGKLELIVDQAPSDGSRPPYSGTPLRTGTMVVGAARTAGKAFSGRLDDLRLYAGLVAGSRLCEDYPDLDSCPR